MPTASFKERLDFYRYTSACLFLSQAKDILLKLKQLTSTDQDSDLSSKISFELNKNILWHAFFTIYSKPFKQTRDAELKMGLRVLDDIVPEDCKHQHQAILTLRDKMYAHTDFHQLIDSNGDPMSKLIIIATENRVSFGQSFVHPIDDQWLEVIEKIHNKCKYHKTKIWESWKKKIHLPQNSRWALNMDPNDDEILKKY